MTQNEKASGGLGRRAWRLLGAIDGFVVGETDPLVRYWYGMDWLPAAGRIGVFVCWLGVFVGLLALGGRGMSARAVAEVVSAGSFCMSAGCVLVNRRGGRRRRWLIGVARLTFWAGGALFMVLEGASVLHWGLYYWRAG